MSVQRPVACLSLAVVVSERPLLNVRDSGTVRIGRTARAAARTSWGDADAGIEAGTPFEELPDDWVCPVCGASKEEFEKLD